MESSHLVADHELEFEAHRTRSANHNSSNPLLLFGLLPRQPRLEVGFLLLAPGFDAVAELIRCDGAQGVVFIHLGEEQLTGDGGVGGGAGMQSSPRAIRRRRVVVRTADIEKRQDKPSRRRWRLGLIQLQHRFQLHQSSSVTTLNFIID